ncbi:ECF transporter S component [Peribacillus glennii]|uniref:ECF transporter S component n=1 Tax=Peribacillus glennii TaxID=2303991 RepID=A0A372L9X6_9BACI|nr:ECF transporter S component [Peribacillus glennii]RFU62394.1 ECF transporter S component [Peribacillus glennii]
MSVVRLSWSALFIALSAVGACIKIPAIVGSIALDSFPALLGAVLLGPVAGATIAGTGHIISAMIGGMPLGSFHFLILFEMAVLAWGYGKLYVAGNRLGASLFFFAGNAVIAPLPFAVLISLEFYMALLPAILAGTLINVVLAFMLTPRLSPIMAKYFPYKQVNR